MTPVLRRGARLPRLLLALALAALAPAAIVAVVPAIYPTPVLVPVAINVGAGDQFDPHVSGDWVAYTSDIGIRYYNFATNVDAAIPPGSSVNDLLSDVSGSKIAFSRVIIGYGTAVMVFDAATPAVASVEIDAAPRLDAIRRRDRRQHRRVHRLRSALQWRAGGS